MDKIFAEIEKGEPVTDERDESRCIASAPSRFIRLRCDNKSNVQESNNFRCAERKNCSVMCWLIIKRHHNFHRPTMPAKIFRPKSRTAFIYLRTACWLNLDWIIASVVNFDIKFYDSRVLVGEKRRKKIFAMSKTFFRQHAFRKKALRHCEAFCVGRDCRRPKSVFRMFSSAGLDRQHLIMFDIKHVEIQTAILLHFATKKCVTRKVIQCRLFANRRRF